MKAASLEQGHCCSYMVCKCTQQCHSCFYLMRKAGLLIVLLSFNDEGQIDLRITVENSTVLVLWFAQLPLDVEAVGRILVPSLRTCCSKIYGVSAK